MRWSVLLSLLVAVPALAQIPGTCEPGTAMGELNVSDVYARVFNGGNLFLGSNAPPGAGYLVPASLGHWAFYMANLVVGGQVNGEVRVSGRQYSFGEFWPGPLDSAGNPPADCTPYDRIYTVSRQDIERFLQTGDATDDLHDWPISLGAPVLDGDGVADNYNLHGGDQPSILGDQMAWWVMNDVGNVHKETGSNPLGIEVQVSAFAALARGPMIDHMTFYRYRLINRSPNRIDSVYIAIYTDTDLGEFGDDYVGSDTTLNLGFTYNAVAMDPYFGIPPSVGIEVIQGPVGLPNGRDDDRDGTTDESDERYGMTAFPCYWKNSSYPRNEPTTKQEWYFCLQGLIQNGEPMTEGGDGYESNGPITTFAYPGFPEANECWSMINNCEGGTYPPYDMRFIVSSGPFRMEPGQVQEVVFAMPYARGVNHLDSVAKLRVAAHVAQSAWDSGILDPSRVEVEPRHSFQLQVSTPFPNPFTDQTTIRYELSEAMAARIVVYDALGREVAILVDAEQQAGSYEVVFDGADLAPGTYIVRFEAAGEERSFSMVKLR